VVGAGEGYDALEIELNRKSRLKESFCSCVLEGTLAMYELSQLAQPQAIITKVETICQSWKHFEVLRNQGIAPARTVLLFGPPGTGKTQIARTIASECDLTFVPVGPSDLTQYVGQHNLQVRKVFQRARACAPSILVVDDIESIAAKRGTEHASQFTDEFAEEMLAQLDDLLKSDRPVFVLAATNYPARVDEAVLSRFMDRIEIPLPDEQGRQLILQSLLAEKPLDFDAAQLVGQLAGVTRGLSGRDLRRLVGRATEKAMGRTFKEGTTDRMSLSREDLLSQLPPAPIEPAASPKPSDPPTA
jgi:transitional endoplasmic reticulum ATPase